MVTTVGRNLSEDSSPIGFARADLRPANLFIEKTQLEFFDTSSIFVAPRGYHTLTIAASTPDQSRPPYLLLRSSLHHVKPRQRTGKRNRDFGRLVRPEANQELSQRENYQTTSRREETQRHSTCHASETHVRVHATNVGQTAALLLTLSGSNTTAVEKGQGSIIRRRGIQRRRSVGLHTERARYPD